MDSTVDITLDEPVLDNVSDKMTSKYKSCYDAFVKWQETNGITSFDEDVLLAYFTEAAKTYKSSTLWCTFAKLKSTIFRNNNVDISGYSQVIAFLKERAVGFESKKFKMFTTEEVNRFLVEAPDEHYLAMKTILVLGVAGGCRGNEIRTFKIDYVKDYGDEIIVNIPATDHNDPKVFVIGGEFAKIVQKYMQLRPARVTTDRFFLQYSQGKCDFHVIGKNKIALVPKEIAKFLQLDDYKSYTGQSIQPANSVIEPGRRRKNKVIQDSFPASQRLDTSANLDLNVEKIIVMPQCLETVPEVFYEITNLNEQEDEISSEPIMPMLSLTTSLMKRKSKYYMGLQPSRFLHLLQLARERNQLTDVKIMLALRKIRLNEDFEVLGDLFDLDKATTERYFHESKHTVVDLVDLLATTAPTINNFDIKTEPIIKMEECDIPYDPDPIGDDTFPNYNYDPTAETYADDQDNADDRDEFKINIPDEDRGYLSNELRKRTAKCSVCDRLYPPRLLNSHMESIHLNLVNLNKTICGLCWKEFDTKLMLKAHQKEAHGGCSYGCDVCSKLFSSKRYLTVHILTYHSLVKTYLCDTCGEGFPVQSSLTYHLKKKHIKRGFDCHLCEKKFITAAALKDHFLAVHTNERPYKCEVSGCGKTFGWPSSFASHQRVHAQDKYECTICSKRFSFKGNLRNHLKTMHNQIVDNKCLASSVI